LIWFVCNATGKSYPEIESYFQEISKNTKFNSYLTSRQTSTNSRKYDSGIEKIGRRIAWYAIVRATQPALVVETGTDKGLGSLVIAEALRQNGLGKLITIDINPKSGQYIDREYEGILERSIGDSLVQLKQISNIDIFIHDSNHSENHEMLELNLVTTKLTNSGIVLTDNAHASDALSEWCKKNAYLFSYFQEVPLDHWYPGASLAIGKKQG
jgi:predicted O-methyltransferase YrrM